MVSDIHAMISYCVICLPVGIPGPKNIQHNVMVEDMGLLHFQHRPVHHISSVHSWWQISIKLIWIALEVKLPQSSLPLRIWNPCRLLHHMPVIAGHISESAADDSWRESVINNCSADCVSQLHNSWVDPDKSTPAHKDAVSKVALLVLCFHVLWWQQKWGEHLVHLKS